jgi:adenylyltransferase/sulfurtransferase
MIFFDASNMKFRNVKIRDRNPECVVCGENPTLKDVSVFNYDDFCQVSCNKYALIKIPPENNITVSDFESIYQDQIKNPANDKAMLIDVRGPVQYKIVSLEGSVNIPLA